MRISILAICISKDMTSWKCHKTKKGLQLLLPGGKLGSDKSYGHLANAYGKGRVFTASE
jgi:hypothetical protein